ncbi:MAG: hypothetical protein ACXWPM_08985 [Bdellovibrionota bacterium]
MTKQTLGWIFVSMACVGFSGCDDYGSAVGVVQTAYVKLSRGDLKGFDQALTNEAFRKFGSAEGMRALADNLAGYDSARAVKAGEPVFTPVKVAGFQTGVETSTIDVLAKTHGTQRESRILTATVLCDVYEVEELKAPSTPMQSGPRAELEPAETSRYTECKISDIRF